MHMWGRLRAHLKAARGQCPERHSSSDPSLQSDRPSQTRYQLMHSPLPRHCDKPMLKIHCAQTSWEESIAVQYQVDMKLNNSETHKIHSSKSLLSDCLRTFSQSYIVPYKKKIYFCYFIIKKDNSFSSQNIFKYLFFFLTKKNPSDSLFLTLVHQILF